MMDSAEQDVPAFMGFPEATAKYERRVAGFLAMHLCK